MAKKISWGMRIITPNRTDLSNLRRANRRARIVEGKRPATITVTRPHPTKKNRTQWLHPTKGWIP